MNSRKGLMIVLVIVCLALAGVTYMALSPKKSTQNSEYDALKARSDEMAEKSKEAAPQRREIPEEPFTPPTGKGPQRVGG